MEEWESSGTVLMAVKTGSELGPWVTLMEKKQKKQNQILELELRGWSSHGLCWAERTVLPKGLHLPCVHNCVAHRPSPAGFVSGAAQYVTVIQLGQADPGKRVLLCHVLPMPALPREQPAVSSANV